MSTISPAPHRAQSIKRPNIEPVIGEHLPRLFGFLPPSLSCVRCQCSELSDDSLIAIVSHSDDDAMVEAAARELSLRLSVPGTGTALDFVASPLDPDAA